MMIRCYMDESFDKQPSGVFAVGGILIRDVPMFELERGWNKLLEKHGLKFLKASDCQNGTGEFRKFVTDPKNKTDAECAVLDSISHEFLRLIVRPVPFDSRGFVCIHGTGIVQTEFYDVIKDANAKKVLGPSPYRLAYDLALIQCAWAMKQLGDGEPGCLVSFVCDEDEEHSDEAEPAYWNLLKTNPKAAEYMGSFARDDEKHCLALQVADAAIYEVRRALNLSLNLYTGTLRNQFDLLADDHSMFLITHTEKQHLEWIVANHKPGEPFKLDELMNLQLGENIDQIRI